MIPRKIKILIVQIVLLSGTILFSRNSTAFLWFPNEITQKELISKYEKFDELIARFYADFFFPYRLNYAKGDQRLQGSLILPKGEREQLIPFLVEFKNYFDQLEKHVANYSLRPSKISKSQYKRLAAKILFYSNAVQFLDAMISYPALGVVFDENMSGYGIPKNYFRNLLIRTTKQRHKGLYNLDSNHFLSDDGDMNFTVMDYALNPEDFSQYLNKSKVSDEVKDIIREALADFIFYNKTFVEKVGRNFHLRISKSGILYDAKVGLIKIVGKMVMDGPNLLSGKGLKKIDDTLKPGDIAVVGSNYKLSNLVIQKNGVTHSLIYIGKYDQLKSSFENDPKVRRYYQKLCLNQGLECDSYISYLEKVYPERMKKYKHSQKDSPYTVVEGIARYGVVFSTTEYAFKRNRVFAFRPKLRKLDIAMAIASALSNIGKEYDYNFELRNTDMMICTELVMDSYHTDVRLEKFGIDWDVSDEENDPVMYANHVLKTYRRGDSNLELVLGIDTGNKYNLDLITE